jgi:histidine phosphotransferase ChpT
MSCSPDLAQRVADRLCHDFMGSVQGMTGALDLIAEAATTAEREEAVGLLGQALDALGAKIRFAREAYGRRSGPTPAAELAALSAALFASLRPELDWRVTAPSLDPRAACALLNLLQIGAECVAAGGRVRVAADRSDTGCLVEVEARGPRARLRAETATALAGSPLAEATAARSVQGAFLRSLAQAAGAEIVVVAQEGAVSLRVSFPAKD